MFGFMSNKLHAIINSHTTKGVAIAVVNNFNVSLLNQIWLSFTWFSETIIKYNLTRSIKITKKNLSE